MFGFFKKKIPAPQHERAKLIWKLYRHRCETDSTMLEIAELTHQDLMDVSTEMLMECSAESVILTLSENFYSLRDQGVTEEDAIKSINEMGAIFAATAGQHLPLLNRSVTFFEFLRFFLDTLKGDTAPITDAILTNALEEIKQHYRR